MGVLEMITRAFVGLAVLLVGSFRADALELSRCLFGPLENAEVYECSKYQVEAADLELNRAYKELKIRVARGYEADPRLGGELLERIKKSQRSWIILRDGNCSIEVFTISPEGQAFETTKNNCLVRESLARARYLEGLSF